MKILGKDIEIGKYYHDIDDRYIIRITDKFNWPEGYFLDYGKCWHSSNYSTPICWQDNGALWITLYDKVSKKGISRCGYLRLNVDFELLFNAAGSLILSDIIKIFANNVNYRSVAIVNDGYVPDTEKVIYVNNSLVVGNYSKWMVKLNFDESGYAMEVCEECGMWCIEKDLPLHSETCEGNGKYDYEDVVFREIGKEYESKE